MKDELSKYFSQLGQKGGRKGKRVLTREQARQMVKVREARRAYKNFFTECFWSNDPNYVITHEDIEWVGQQLLKNGGRKAYEIGVKLCH